LKANASTPVANAVITIQDVQSGQCDIKTFGGGAINSGSNSLTVQTDTFTSDDVELPIRIAGAGGPGPLYSQIGHYIGPTQVRLSQTADNDANSATVFWGTDDTAPIQAAIDAANAKGGGIVFFPVGTFVIDGAKHTANGKNYGLKVKSNVTLSGAGWTSILRLKDRSTDNKVDPQMFFAGPTGSLSNIVFDNLAFHGNSRHNPLGMACGIGGGSLGDNRNCCAIWIGGLNYHEGVWLTGFTVQQCYFTDFPGRQRNRHRRSICIRTFCFCSCRHSCLPRIRNNKRYDFRGIL
jgi:hypothetical protein